VQIKYDFSGLNKALSQKIQLSRTPVVDIVQDAAMKVLIGSGTGDGLVQLTRKATVARITADLNKPVAGRTNAVRLKSGKMRAGRPQTKPLLFWLALQVMKRTGAGNIPEIVRQTMAAILKMRIKSRAYIAAGWLHCARDLHEKSPYLQKKHKLTRLKARNIPTVDKAAGGTAAQSFSITYTGDKQCSVKLFNTSRGGDTVGMEFVQQAINNATKDVQVYIDNKVGKEILKQIFQRGGLVVT
jgi:hypothetical protein